VRLLANLLAFAVAGFASADLVGQWRGIATLGPSNIAQTMDGDGLLKLQISKAFLKTLNYSFDFKADKSFVSIVVGEDIRRRTGKGTWTNTGNLVTITFTEENGKPRSGTLSGTLSPDGKKLLISINSKPGLPPTKLVFKKTEATAPVKPGAAKSTGH
jgi:hypothetical protein